MEARTEPDNGALAKGTRIIAGPLAARRRHVIATLSELALRQGFSEVVLPTIEPTRVYTDKAGEEVLRQMWTFEDKKGRETCLRPEGTATLQLLARTEWKHRRDVRLHYVVQCFRYEQPQAGRYREFTQFGVEILNPKDPAAARRELVTLAEEMAVRTTSADVVLDEAATHGLAYYVGDGFEITAPSLGAQKQILGGGSYDEGVGFAFGVDRLMLLPEPTGLPVYSG